MKPFPGEFDDDDEAERHRVKHFFLDDENEGARRGARDELPVEEPPVIFPDDASSDQEALPPPFEVGVAIQVFMLL